MMPPVNVIFRSEEQLAEAETDRAAYRIEVGGLIADRSRPGGVADIDPLIKQVVQRQRDREPLSQGALSISGFC